MQQTIITILLSGITATLVTTIYNYFIVRRSFLREQLDELYAPLYLGKSILEEYMAEYTKTIESSTKLAEVNALRAKEFSSMTTMFPSNLNDTSFEILGNYLINKDSELSGMSKLIRRHFSLIDIDDVDTFITFVHYWEKVRIEIIEPKHKNYELLQIKGLLNEKPLKELNEILQNEFYKKKNILQYTYIGFKLRNWYKKYIIKSKE